MPPPSQLGLSGPYWTLKAPARTRRAEPPQASLSSSLGLEYLYPEAESILTLPPRS